MKVKDAIKLLPLDEGMKGEILEKFDQMSPEKQLAISRMAWNYYYTVYGQSLEKNLDDQFQQVLKGEEHFGKDYYAKAVKKTDGELTKVAADASTKTDLVDTREELQEILDGGSSNNEDTSQQN